MRQLPLAKERRKLDERTSIGLEVAVIVLSEIPNEDMKRDVVLSEPSLTSTEKNVSGRWAMRSAPSSVRWSLIVTNRIPRFRHTGTRARDRCRTRRGARDEARSYRCRSSTESERADRSLAVGPLPEVLSAISVFPGKQRHDRDKLVTTMSPRPDVASRRQRNRLAKGRICAQFTARARSAKVRCRGSASSRTGTNPSAPP